MAGESETVPAVLRTLTFGSPEWPSWKTRGVLRPQALRQGMLTRLAPVGEMSAVVDLYWIVRLDFAPGESKVVETLPHPCVNVAGDSGRVRGARAAARTVHEDALRARMPRRFICWW